MNKKFWTAAAVALAVSGAAMAGEMTKGAGGSANPGDSKGVTTPKQPNETQPGQMSGAGEKGDMKGMKGEKGMAKGEKGAKSAKGKGEMKDDTTAGTGMSSGSSNPGNPAEKGSRTPKQPNETQPGTGSTKNK